MDRVPRWGTPGDWNGSPSSGRVLAVAGELPIHTEASSTDFNRVAWLHHGTCGSPSSTMLRHSRAVQAARLLQAAVPISATFAAPFCARPDPGDDEFMGSSVSPQLACRTWHLGLPTRAPPRGPPWRSQEQLPLDERTSGWAGIDPPALDS
jgi:hypothetical protein